MSMARSLCCGRFIAFVVVINCLQSAGADSPLPENRKPAVYSSYDKKSGKSFLCANQALLTDGRTLPKFQFVDLWKYDADKKIWVKRPVQVTIPPVLKTPEHRQVISAATDQKLVELSKEIGLFWVRWKEDEQECGAFVFAGPILCNDVMIGAAPAGMVAVCVPAADSATAMFVPDPKLNCR